MANVDRPNGLVFVKTLSGAPISAAMRSIGVTDGADMFAGDAINLASGLAAVGATNDAAFLGVAVSFSKRDDLTSSIGAGPANPDNLAQNYYDDSASTHTDYVVNYIPATDAIFEAQTATALTLAVGATCDLLATAGDTTTGRSKHEITTSSNADFSVVEVPDLPDNDNTLVNGRYWVKFVTAEQAFHA